jgi:tetratricopeptide (TPR) repeat protein
VVGQARVLTVTDRQLNLSKLGSRFLFFSDANEGGDMHPAMRSLDSMLVQKRLSGLSYKYMNYPEESHGSEPVKAIYDALKWLYPSWYPRMEDSTAFLVQEHFSQLSVTYGYKILPPEWFVARRGTRILNNGRIDDAIAFFTLNTTNYPASTEACLLLGNAYVKKNNKAKAIEYYQRAAKLSPGNKEIEQKIDSLIK